MKSDELLVLEAILSELHQIKSLLIQQQNQDMYRIPIDISPEKKWPDRPTTDDFKDDEKPAIDVMR